MFFDAGYNARSMFIQKSNSISSESGARMACELAPVVTDIPVNRAWIEDGKNGFLVSIGDAQSLADKIAYLMRNKQVQEDCGKVNRRIVQQKDEYETEMAKMETVYGALNRGTVVG